MSYDNSVLLKNYLHAMCVSEKHDWEASFDDTAQSIVLWVNEVLSDQQNGGFYASQDADYSLDDDGDYFTWTLEEVRTVLSAQESRFIEQVYDIETHGEMHHNLAKNVLWISGDSLEVGKNLGLSTGETVELSQSAKTKLLAARLQRSTPYVDKTMYVAWNAMFVSAYLEAGRIFRSHFGSKFAEDCRAFALKTLDRMLNEVWSDSRGFSQCFQ